jgi:hypothetical protein
MREKGEKGEGTGRKEKGLKLCLSPQLSIIFLPFLLLNLLHAELVIHYVITLKSALS